MLNIILPCMVRTVWASCSYLREDYIRNQAVLEAKMDSIQQTLTNLYKMESAKK